MVRNTKGGRNHKKMSSRGTRAPPRSKKLRLPEQEGEILAVVLKLFGHGMVEVMCNDGVVRLCVIRKKFRGRNKRDNEIRMSSLLLVGIRAFEVVAVGKKHKTDLIYVYSDNDKMRLKQGGHVTATLCPEMAKKKDEGFIFSKEQNIQSKYGKWDSEAAAPAAEGEEEAWLADMIDDI